MIAASRRSFLVATILIVALSATVHGRIVRYQTAIRSLANGSATFRTVDAIPARDEANPARVFTGGFYSDQFQIGTTVPGVTSKNREDGILAALTNDPETETWETDWLLTVDCEGGDAVIDDIAMGPDGLLVVGATSEPEAGFSEGLTPEGQKQLQAGITALLPEASQWPPMERWWGFRPCTPDEGPLLGASPMAGLWLACGHHRNGVLLAAITAELLAGAITQETPSSADAALLGAFSWKRF